MVNADIKEYIEEKYGLHLDSYRELENVIWDLQSQLDNWEQ